MAIQHTQGKWEASQLESIQGGKLPSYIIMSNDGKSQVCHVHPKRTGCGDHSYDVTKEQATANAALICDAVNNTVGKGIDPNAVPGLLEALKEAKDLLHTLRVESLYRAHNQRKKQMDKIEQAIKSADLK